ncbi:MAG: glycosyltransferase family 2 protein [Deltaproteobacteria bacterium]|nr:glycosyltransferase family 2 protein [Deltaproteobacteria bacterium]
MKSSKNKLVSLVIPAYNESKRIPGSLKKIQVFADEIPILFEVIVIVEKSSDNTLENCRDAVEGDTRFKIVDNHVHRGKGYAVRSGMLMARGDIIFFMDADLSTDLGEIVRFIEYFALHPEIKVVIGSRAHARSRILKRQNLLRETMGKVFNIMVQAFSIKGISDTQCGFKAFRKDAAREIFFRQTDDGFAFDVEVLLLARKLGFPVAVLPVTWINSSESRVNVFLDSFKMLRSLCFMRILVARALRKRPFE